MDLAELHLHDGILFLFAHVPTPPVTCNWQEDPTARNFSFRLDRIQEIRTSTDIPWYRREFPTLTVQYRLQGDLKNYQPRRPQEKIVEKTEQYVIVESAEISSFWFQQRILRYLPNFQILFPDWLRHRICRVVQAGLANLSVPEGEP